MEIKWQLTAAKRGSANPAMDFPPTVDVSSHRLSLTPKRVELVAGSAWHGVDVALNEHSYHVQDDLRGGTRDKLGIKRTRSDLPCTSQNNV
jgi:hypothetical protein